MLPDERTVAHDVAILAVASLVGAAVNLTTYFYMGVLSMAATLLVGAALMGFKPTRRFINRTITALEGRMNERKSA